jgi:hypothetical protein
VSKNCQRKGGSFPSRDLVLPMGGGGDGYGGVRYQEWTKLAKARVLANDNSPTNSPRLIGADSQLAMFALETHSPFCSMEDASGYPTCPNIFVCFKSWMGSCRECLLLSQLHIDLRSSQATNAGCASCCKAVGAASVSHPSTVPAMACRRNGFERVAWRGRAVPLFRSARCYLANEYNKSIAAKDGRHKKQLAF